MLHHKGSEIEHRSLGLNDPGPIFLEIPEDHFRHFCNQRHSANNSYLSVANIQKPQSRRFYGSCLR